MVGSRSMQLVEELKKWQVHPESAIAQQSSMVDVAGTKLVEDVILLILDILVSLVPCPYEVGFLIMEQFLVFILVAHSL